MSTGLSGFPSDLSGCWVVHGSGCKMGDECDGGELGVVDAFEMSSCGIEESLHHDNMEVL